MEEELADLATPVPACGTATPEAAGAQASEEEGGCGPAACPADLEGTPEAEQAELAKEDPAQPDEAGRAAASPVRPAGTGGTVRKDSIVMLPKGSRKDSILLLPTAARRHSLRGLYATMVLPPGLERGHAGEGLPCPTSGAVALGRRLRSRDASNSDTEGCTGQGGAPPGRLLPLPAPEDVVTPRVSAVHIAGALGPEAPEVVRARERAERSRRNAAQAAAQRRGAAAARRRGAAQDQPETAAPGLEAQRAPGKRSWSPQA